MFVIFNTMSLFNTTTFSLVCPMVRLFSSLVKVQYCLCLNRRLRSRMKCRPIIAIISFLTGFIFFKLVALLYIQGFTCSMVEGRRVLNDICELYNKGDLFGNLCDSICVREEIHHLNCIAHHSGKDIVFVAQLKDRNVVFKSSYADVNKFDQLYYEDKSVLQTRIFPQMDRFLDMVIQSVTFNHNQSFNMSQKSNIINLLWTHEFRFLKSLPSSQQHEAMSNIWYLLQQHEYVLSKLFSTHKLFPAVIGSCGHLYAVEYLKPLDNLFNVLHPSWRYPFALRSQWALDLIRLFQRFDNSFRSILHVCDVKMGHFGFAEDGTLRLLDLDMAYFEENLKANMIAPGACSNDQDCAFIDCQGSCSNRKCKSTITNSNLQRLCSNLLYGYLGQELFGLLGSTPVDVQRSDLHTLLLICISSQSSAKAAVTQIEHILKANFDMYYQ